MSRPRKTTATDGTPPYRYTAALADRIERRWQRRWAAEGTFHTPNPTGSLADGFGAVSERDPFYVLDMFPYPSGDTLHVGNTLGYIGTDVYARYLRMSGRNVLHTMGFDAFGLPAEQHAIETGEHPARVIDRNVATMRRQLDRLGLGHDRRREVRTSDPSFYRWTQWIFLQLFDSWYDPQAGRARPIAELVEQFESGAREPAVGPAPTDPPTVGADVHADPNPARRSWADLDRVTRRRIVDTYRLAYRAKAPVNWCPALGTVLADEEVTAEGRSERGDHPVYRRRLTQWMLRITAYAERLLDGLEAVDWPEHVVTMQRNWIGRSEGHGAVAYRLRDWLFSRQRYWGEPFPIVYDEHDLPHPVPDDQLPVVLPDLDDFAPRPADPEADPVPRLSRASDWVEAVVDLGDGPRSYRRETNTMPQWAGSSWYYLRYLDPTNGDAIVEPEVERYWMAGGHRPGAVDLYVGGVEHAVLHLLYVRFWHQVLHDRGHVSSPEPFQQLFNQGYVLADAYVDERGIHVPAAEVEVDADGDYTWRGRPVEARTGKMGKSLKNSVPPDDVIADYGVDTLRLYLMASGPLDADRPWRPDDIIGVHRFLQRLWRNLVDEATGASRVTEVPADDELRRELHRTIRQVRDDIERLKPNAAIAALIGFNNKLTARTEDVGRCPREIAEPLVRLIAPFAPHIAEELWERLGHRDTLTYEHYPEADPTLLAADRIRIPVQVDGKVRTTMEVDPVADRGAVASAALDDERIERYLGGTTIQGVIVIPGRVVNIVTRPRR